MSSVIYTNMASLVAQKNLLGAQNALSTSVERLSSGLRINRARDDAAGLSVANSLQSQINGANQGIRNMNDAISMVQTAEGAIAAASEMGQRIQTLATQAANSTLGPEPRASIRLEMLKLVDSIDSITKRTDYAGNKLLTFSENATAVESYYSMQISNNSTDKIGLNSDAFLNIGSGPSVNTYKNYTAVAGAAVGTTYKDVYVEVGTGIFTKKNLEINTTTAGTTATYKLDGAAYTPGTPPLKEVDTATTTATGQINLLKAAITGAIPGDATTFAAIQTEASKYVVALGEQRSLLGSYQNQMEYTLANITELSSNLSAAKSRVIDTDYAAETAALTRGQILQQAATAMLAQANQMPNVILTLLK